MSTKNASRNQNSVQGEIDLSQQLRRLINHKYPIAAAVLAGAFLGALYSVASTPVYRADAMLEIETKQNQILTEIKRKQRRGERPRFVQYGRGHVGLSQWMGHGLESQIEEHNQQVRKDLYKRLLAMKPGEFEILVSLLLTEMGFETVEVTKLSGDGGIDVRGTLVVGEAVRIKMAVQAKRWKNNVQAPVVQQVRGSLGAHEQGLIITTSDFSPGAVKEAAQPDKTPIALMNGEQLVMLLMEHDIGVLRSTPDLFELDEDTLATRVRE